MIAFPPTQQQNNILDGLVDTQDNLVVEARAGSGKTSTIRWLFGHLPNSDPHALVSSLKVFYMVFNKHTADAMRGTVPSFVDVVTGHALGLRALKASGIVPRNVKVDAGKCRKYVYDKLRRDDPDLQGVLRLVSLLKSTVGEADSSSARRLSVLHDLSFENPDRAYKTALAVLECSNRDLDTIDFDDMLYLAVTRNARFEPADWVFVDEAQDTNDIQLEILSRLKKLGPYLDNLGPDDDQNSRHGSSTRYVFVGDTFQSIYGFRGANADSMDRIRSRFACKPYPLSVSFRCPRSVCSEAQNVLTQPIN